MSISIHDLRGKKLGVCVSGGLDSKTISMRLREAGCDVLCFTADLAQPDETDIQGVVKKMAPCGVETVVVDLKKEMADICLETVKCEATYDGGYWNSTGIGRAVTVKGLVGAMKARGGSSGGARRLKSARPGAILPRRSSNPTRKDSTPWHSP